MVCVFSIGSYVFNDILLSRCITKFSFMFVLKTLVKSRIMRRVLKVIILSTNVDENKERKMLVSKIPWGDYDCCCSSDDLFYMKEHDICIN
jgi:hypothetical protein